MQTLQEGWGHILLQGNAETGICVGVWGKYKDLEGRMERLACKKKDIEGSGEQEDRQTGENASFVSAQILIPHMWEKYQGWSFAADCSWGADEAGHRRFKAKSPTQTPSARRVRRLTLVYTTCRMFWLCGSIWIAQLLSNNRKKIAASVQEPRTPEIFWVAEERLVCTVLQCRDTTEGTGTLGENCSENSAVRTSLLAHYRWVWRTWADAKEWLHPMSSHWRTSWRAPWGAHSWVERNGGRTLCLFTVYMFYKFQPGCSGGKKFSDIHNLKNYHELLK